MKLLIVVIFLRLWTPVAEDQTSGGLTVLEPFPTPASLNGAGTSQHRICQHRVELAKNRLRMALSDEKSDFLLPSIFASITFLKF